jgi:hypothetical protein
MWPIKDKKSEPPAAAPVEPKLHEYWGSYTYVWRCKCGMVLESLRRASSSQWSVALDVCPKCGRDASMFTKVSARPRVRVSEDCLFQTFLYWEDAPKYDENGNLQVVENKEQQSH